LPDEAAAVDGPWPDEPDFRPLPVAVLSALTGDVSDRAEAPAIEDDPGSGPPPSAEAYPCAGHDLHRTPEPPSGSLPAGANDPDGAHAMDAVRLIIEVGRARGRAVAVREPRLLIGRDHGCHLRPGSASISRFHAALERRGGRLVLQDLGSTNGTLLNGRLLR